jgi:hypothetical protein
MPPPAALKVMGDVEAAYDFPLPLSEWRDDGYGKVNRHFKF